eukprot:Platyproteum_vivax@DN6655_c0_g1_i2.p1
MDRRNTHTETERQETESQREETSVYEHNEEAESEQELQEEVATNEQNTTLEEAEIEEALEALVDPETTDSTIVFTEEELIEAEKNLMQNMTREELEERMVEKTIELGANRKILGVQVAAEETRLRERFENEVAKRIEQYSHRWHLNANEERAAREAELLHNYEQKMAKLRKFLTDEKLKEIQQLENINSDNLASERELHLLQIADVKGRLEAMDDVFEIEAAIKKDRHRLSKLTLALLTLEDLIAEEKPLGQAYGAVCRLSNIDAIADVVINSLPEDVKVMCDEAENYDGLTQLNKQFTYLVDDLIHNAFIPPGWGLAGHGIGSLFGKLYSLDAETIQERPTDISSWKGPGGNTRQNLDLTTLTVRLIQNGKWIEALESAENMTGFCKELVHDWCVQTRRVLTLLQAIKVIKCRIECLNAQFV